MEEAKKLYQKYLEADWRITRNAAKKCALLEVLGREEEIKNKPGMQQRITELELVKEAIMEL